MVAGRAWWDGEGGGREGEGHTSEGNVMVIAGVLLAGVPSLRERERERERERIHTLKKHYSSLYLV